MLRIIIATACAAFLTVGTTCGSEENAQLDKMKDEDAFSLLEFDTMTEEDAWSLLAKWKDVSQQSLSSAVLAIVSSNNDDKLDKLVSYIEKEDFLKFYNYPKEHERQFETYPFSVLMIRIAQCDNLLAEKLLTRLAQSEKVTCKMQGGRPQTYDRSIAIIVAISYLQPKTEQTYTILENGVDQLFCMGPTIPLCSLAIIGTDKSAKLIRKDLFTSEKHWSSRNVPFYFYEIGKGRDHLAIFALLIDLAEEAPNNTLKRHAMKALTSDRSEMLIIDGGTFPLPSYNTVSKKTRKQMQERVALVDNAKFDNESKKLLDKLDQLLKKESETPKKPEPKEEKPFPL